MNWFKASASSGGDNCVQVAHEGDLTYLRDSKLADDSPVLAFDGDEWSAFLDGASKGEFNRP